MTLSGLTKVVVVLSAVAVWLLPTPVSASLWIVLDRTSGPGGTVVHGRTLGSGSVTLATSRSLPLFLVKHDLASQIDDPIDERLIRLGELVVDSSGDGTTSFTIPDVTPGQYDVFVHCEPCAPSSAGATMLFVADLKVSLTPPPTDTVDVSTFGAWPPFTFVVTVATLLLFRRVQETRMRRA
jgi:hypothetical protein